MLSKNKKLDSLLLQLGQGPCFFYQQDASVNTFLELHAKTRPHAAAVRFHKQSLTYLQLNSQVNQLSNYLIRNGLNSGQKVAIYFTPSLEQVISILAILKIGCCYVPLDIHYPIDRLTFMINDCSVSYLLTQSALSTTFSDINIHCIVIDENLETIDTQETIFDSRNKPDDLAYIIYTSGSTGVPNGVKIHHRAINNHMLWMKEHFQFTSEDKIILKTALSFDPSIWELLLPFYVGCALILAPAGANMEPDLLIETIIEQAVTTVQIVPSFLKELVKSKQLARCQSLRHVFCGGESLSAISKKLFFEQLNCPLYNLYGPTEATIDITSHAVSNTEFDITTNIIGKPIYNTVLYVVNIDGELAEIGKEGELYIGSDSLSPGYYNRDGLTQERFIDNPFEPQKYSKVYKTSDIVRWLPNGTLEYLGRNNDQIKINGVRIEPNEIVSIILKQSSISDSVIVKKTDFHGYDYLVCYIVLKNDIKQFDITPIKAALQRNLPQYMLPKTYVKVNKIPLTLNGKVDISALPEPYYEKGFNAIANTSNVTEVERKLLLIWQTILGALINCDDNFFEVGGTSLLALKLLAELKATWKIKISIAEIFTHPTVKMQEKLIQSRCNLHAKTKINRITSVSNPIVTLQPQGSSSPLFLIHPIGGTIFWYFWLAKLLKKTRPIYGIQDPSIELEKPIFNSIAEIASFYIEQIKKIQPTGKYLIGGASFGTTIAIEIAYLLEKEGKEVSSIISLDGWGVYPNTLYKDNYFRKSMERQHSTLKTEFGKLALQKPESLFDIQWQRLSLLKNYQVKKTAFPMVLFKSQEILPVFQEINSAFNHWEKIFDRKKLHYYLVPGNHETMFQRPHVETLATLIDNYFEVMTL
jgi:amino acid adenylation domain-containing protein